MRIDPLKIPRACVEGVSGHHVLHGRKRMLKAMLRQAHSCLADRFCTPCSPLQCSRSGPRELVHRQHLLEQEPHGKHGGHIALP